MDALELLDLIQKGESSTVQFKVRIDKKDKKKSAYDLGTEMVAFANTKGGTLIVGVVDETGEIDGLTYEELQATNQLLANVSTNNVKAAINIFTETVEVGGEKVIVVQVPEGISKPHTDNKGIIWVKNGSDKRTVTSREEMARLLQSSGNLFADETLVHGATINDIDDAFFNDFIGKKYGKSIDELGLSVSKLLSNMGMFKEDCLSLGGLLLLGKNPQRYKATFTVHCISMRGNDISSNLYRNKKEPFTGNISEVYDKTLSFIIQNLKEIQKDDKFNSLGELEVPIETIEELLVNALVHRDYFINSSIKVFIFDNRIEIISPGRLPNTLTIENIKAGISVIRNPILYSNARYLLPFKGAGSGIMRALKNYPDIELINDTERELFISIIKRNPNL